MKDVIVEPLAITQVHWEKYIKMTEDALGFSPTRGLDKASISIERPNAYLASLSLDNDPIKNLSKGRYLGNSYDHMFMSFICIVGSRHVIALSGYSINVLVKKTIDEEYLIIVSGTMTQWYDDMIKGIKDRILNPVFKKFYEYFKRADIDVWGNDLSKKQGL